MYMYLVLSNRLITINQIYSMPTLHIRVLQTQHKILVLEEFSGKIANPN